MGNAITRRSTFEVLQCLKPGSKQMHSMSSLNWLEALRSCVACRGDIAYGRDYRGATRSQLCRGDYELPGNVMPVIDLRRRPGLPTSEHTKNTRIMAVSLNSGTVGMIVDAVSESRNLLKLLEPRLPSFLTSHRLPDGIAKMGSDDQEGKLVVILISLRSCPTSRRGSGGV